eukprot:3140480-Pyramimonas_sp.AAC.1
MSGNGGRGGARANLAGALEAVLAWNSMGVADGDDPWAQIDDIWNSECFENMAAAYPLGNLCGLCELGLPPPAPECPEPPPELEAESPAGSGGDA